MAKKFSIIIPTCQRNDLLALCLERLAPGKQTLAFDSYEVIVTDDGSDSPAETLVKDKFPWAQWVQGPRKGPAANRNNGAGRAQGEWLIFTDDDCLPEPGWLTAYAEAAGGGAAPRVLEGRTLPVGERTGLLQDCPINDKGGHLWSCNFALRRELFQELGGFDERFLYAAMEDVELSYRLKKHGTMPVFVAGALVLHPWKTIDFRRHRRRHLWSEMLYLQIHPEETRSIHWWYHARCAVRFWVKDFSRLLKQFPGAAIRLVPVFLADQCRTVGAHLLHRSPEHLKPNCEGGR